MKEEAETKDDERIVEHQEKKIVAKQTQRE